MFSCSRGLFAPGLRPLFRPGAMVADFSCARNRLLSTSNGLRGAAKAPAAKVAAKSASPSKARLPARPSSPPSKIPASEYAILKNLASKPSPTMLYEAPSHFWFYFGCWTSGITLLTWTVMTGPQLMNPPEGTGRWVGWVFTVVYAMFGSIGFWLIAKTPNIVQSIRLLPTKKAPSPSTKPTAAVAAVAAAPAQPQLELTVKSMVPFKKPRVIKANLEAVALKTRFSLPEEFVPDLKRREIAREEEKRRAALHKFDMEHLFTMPFRRIIRAFKALFQGVLSAWTDKGMGIIKVDGKQFKVDVTKGFAHDGFRTLERIVKIEGR
ncbi:hypothetical protein B0I35DRAFT_473233 [Stachybotrys elegans]|uniref:Uncharacterized protein n=1 Tax=Stachybotrys elegans TaxID=80388 RepID=A0A8K0WWC9_9HYPO|nr:hypothetical protein B0I35DRAFT_473233 [Stachybotrys elegans]